MKTNKTQRYWSTLGKDSPDNTHCLAAQVDGVHGNTALKDAIAEKLWQAQDKIQALIRKLIKSEFGYNTANVKNKEEESSGGVEINVGQGLGAATSTVDVFPTSEPASFTNLVGELKAKVEEHLTGQGLDRAEYIAGALEKVLGEGTVKGKIKELLEKEFGITSANVSQVQLQGSKVTVTINKEGTNGEAGTAEVSVTKEGGSQATVIFSVNVFKNDNNKIVAKEIAKAFAHKDVIETVKSQGYEFKHVGSLSSESAATSIDVKNAKRMTEAFGIAHNIAKKLGEAQRRVIFMRSVQYYTAAGGTSSFHALVNQLAAKLESLGKGTDASDVASKLRDALRQANEQVDLTSTESSESFKALVNQLKEQPGFSLPSENLDKDNLRQALNGAQTQIKDLVKSMVPKEKESDVTGSNIKVSDGGSNKVIIQVGDGGGAQDSKSTTLKGSRDQELTLEVKIDRSIVGISANPYEMAYKLAQAIQIAHEGGRIKPVQQLVRTDFELPSATVAVTEGGTNVDKKVTVTIDGGRKGQGAATLLVLKQGGKDVAELKIEVSGGGDKAQDIALRLADALADPRVKAKLGIQFPDDIRLQGGGLRNAMFRILTH